MTSTSLTRAASRALILHGRRRRVGRRPLGVHARIAALEAEAEENRQLDRRVAELTDLVADLLAPRADPDETRLGEDLRDYRGRM